MKHENKKTCGECKYMSVDCLYCKKHLSTLASLDQVSPFCGEWEPKTNGDKIRQMSNEELAEIFDDLYNGNKCHYCINNISGNCKFEDKHAEYDEGGWVEDEDCISGFEAWLNAPADCVKQNGNDDTQTDLCTADNTESEGKSE